jgi:dTDP-4-amino-4,6-dideoxygalactose transaminase
MTGTFGDYGCFSFNGNNIFEMDSDAVLCNKYARKAA